MRRHILRTTFPASSALITSWYNCRGVWVSVDINLCASTGWPTSCAICQRLIQPILFSNITVPCSCILTNWCMTIKLIAILIQKRTHPTGAPYITTAPPYHLRKKLGLAAVGRCQNILWINLKLTTRYHSGNRFAFNSRVGRKCAAGICALFLIVPCFSWRALSVGWTTASIIGHPITP